MRHSRSLLMFVAGVALLGSPGCLVSGWQLSDENMALAALTPEEIQKSFPRPNWGLKYRSGSLPLKKEQWLKGAFVKSESADKQTSPTLVISRDQVRAIYFNPVVQKDSDLLQRMPRSGCHAAKSLMPENDSVPGPDLFLVWVSSPAPMARAAEHLNARYPVQIVWNEDGADKELVLTVSYCEYASFLANLRWFAGPRWQAIRREFPRH